MTREPAAVMPVLAPINLLTVLPSLARLLGADAAKIQLWLEQQTQHNKERGVALAATWRSETVELLQGAQQQLEQQGLQLQLPHGCASPADLLAAPAQLVEQLGIDKRGGNLLLPSTAAALTLNLGCGVPLPRAAEAAPGASLIRLLQILRHGGADGVVQHLQQAHGAVSRQAALEAANAQCGADTMAARAAEYRTRLSTACSQLERLEGVPPELVEAARQLQPSDAYLKRFRAGKLPAASTVAATLLRLYGLDGAAIEGLMGAASRRAAAKARHKLTLLEWALPPLLAAGAASPDVQALREAAGEPDTSTGTQRLSRVQQADWFAYKWRLLERACRLLAALLQQEKLSPAEAAALVSSLAQLPLPAGWDAFTGKSIKPGDERVALGGALLLALPDAFGVGEAAAAVGSNEAWLSFLLSPNSSAKHDDPNRVLPLLRPVRLLVVKELARLAREQPELFSPQQLAAEQLCAAAGLVQRAEAAPDSPATQFWQLSVVPALCGTLAAEVQAGHLGAANAREAARSVSALTPPAGWQPRTHRLFKLRSAVAVVLFALGQPRSDGSGTRPGMQRYKTKSAAGGACGKRNMDIERFGWVAPALGVALPAAVPKKRKKAASGGGSSSGGQRGSGKKAKTH